jgi:membrane-bound PQQ-dependent dehydrogenase (glucose/quinate/shikimate family)
MGEIISGYYYVSSAPQIVRGRIVVGGWVSDGQMTGEPAGVIRAFDAVTGAFAWAFDIGNPDDHGEPAPGKEYTRGTPNSWAPISADEELGLVYLPIGNATPDYWGGHRTAQDNRFASSVLALDAETGALRWSFQTVHYDLWDYDVGSQPCLIDLTIGGERVPALVQATKRGQNFVLDRRSGKPLFEVQELPAPQGGVEDPARLSQTQPYSVGMPRFDGLDATEPLGLGERHMWGLTPFDQLWSRIKFRRARWQGTMTPPGTDNTINYPGSLGGSNWGSLSFDPERGVMVGQWNRMGMYLRLMPRAEADARGLKPATSAGRDVGGDVAQAGTPYAAELSPFLSPLGVPAIAPPYALVTAVDLNTQKVIWTRRSGTAEDSGPLGLRSRLPIPMGVPGLGGAITTRSGLVFIAASGEQSLRAMDLRTGDVLWKGRLPAGGNATPMTYLSPESGRQFVVIAAGGHNLMRTQPGDYIVAYALPNS